MKAEAKSMRKPPDHWGEDSLSSYLQESQENAYATFALLARGFHVLAEVEDAYRVMVNSLNDTSELQSALFFMRAHGSYLGGCRLALSGQLNEAYMVLRGCIENSLYGIYFWKCPEAFEIWSARHKDEKSKKKVRELFLMGALMKVLQGVDHRTWKDLNELYDRTIDFGAHPNSLSLFTTLTVEKREERVDYKVNYLVGNSKPLHLCLQSTAQVGIASLMAFRNVFPNQYEAIGLMESLESLRQKNGI